MKSRLRIVATWEGGQIIGYRDTWVDMARRLAQTLEGNSPVVLDDGEGGTLIIGNEIKNKCFYQITEVGD